MYKTRAGDKAHGGIVSPWKMYGETTKVYASYRLETVKLRC